MRVRIVGAVAFVAASVIPQQSPASAVQCMSTGVVECRVYSTDPVVCVYAAGEEICVHAHMDICVWTADGQQITCAPIVWPPV